MSIQSEIDSINGNVASTYTALSEMGATMPEQQNSDNLPGTVRTVPQGGASVQTDWNQTDETAPDFLKNKPFYDEYNSVKFDSEITLDESGYTEFEEISLVVGKLYSVRYGDNIYQTTAVDLEPTGFAGYIGIGNLSDFEIDDGNDCPFQIVTVADMATFVQDMAGAVSTTLRLVIVEGDNIGDTVYIEDATYGFTYLRKVSDAIPSEADFNQGYQIKALVEGTEVTIDNSNSTITPNGKELDIIYDEIGFPVALIVIGINEDMSVPVGTYLIDSSAFDKLPFDIVTHSLRIHNSTVFAPKLEMKRMDKKFLPENIVLTSPSGKQFNITVDDSGVLTATEVTE